MGWITMSLRTSELQNTVHSKEFDLVKLNQKRNKLSSFSNAIGDGHINPSEIASIGSELFGDALDFMGYSKEFAMEAAELQSEYYASAYGDVTSAQYMNNPNMAPQGTLYFDESGQLNLDMMYNEFFEEALEEFVNTVMMPKINEIEKELDEEKLELETDLQAAKAELDVVKQSVSDDIQRNTIRLS